MLYKNNNFIVYVRQDDRKFENFKTRICRFLRKCFVKNSIENIENGNIILIPKYKNYNKFIRKIIIKQIKKIAQEDENYKFVFEEKIQFLSSDLNFILKREKNDIKSENNEINLMKAEKFELLNGKELMKIYLLDILDYIFKLNNKNMNLENIYLCVDEYNKYTLQIIQKIILKFKTVNIVTENLLKYQRLENSIYENGELITVSNNKKKSLRNAKYIINFDFLKEKLEKYNICNNAVIINLNKKNLDLVKCFSGIIINNFELKIDKNQSDYIKEYYGEIKEKIFIESMYFRKGIIYDFDNQIGSQFNAKITELVGVRGNIQKREFLA